MSKKTTYPLLALALIVWGIVLWRVLLPAGKSVPPSATTGGAAAAPTERRDTLLLNYRDPFLGARPEAPRKTDAPAVVQALPPTPPPRENVAFSWQGTITRKEQRYYLITLGQRQHMLRRGEEADGFLLTLVSPDSLVLTKNGQTYTAKRP